MSTSSDPPLVIENLTSGIDWLTVTTKAQEKRAAMYYECEHLKEVVISSGERLRKWTFKGYTGWMVGGLRWGTRLDSDIAMLSGVDAHQNWYICGDWAQNCSRIDLAVTVELQNVFPGLLRLYDGCLQRVNLRGVKYKGSIIKDSDGGQTLYVQRRVTGTFGRVYDKGIEAGLHDEPGRMWRYEVQFGDRYAKAILAQVLANKYIPQGAHWNEEVAQSIVSTVYTWFLARNLPPIFSRSENPALSLEVEARVTSDEVSLNWLTTQVQPTVSRLAEKGKLEQVKRALGISDDVQSWMERTAQVVP